MDSKAHQQYSAVVDELRELDELTVLVMLNVPNLPMNGKAQQQPSAVGDELRELYELTLLFLLNTLKLPICSSR